MPDVENLFQRLQNRSQHSNQRSIVVGVVTNSDDRVPDILSSLGLRVNPARHGQRLSAAAPEAKCDVDFAIMSFDVGHEKPDPAIFRAAEDMVRHSNPGNDDQGSWQKVYVGDEYKKDVLGAVNAGWNAILVGPREEISRHSDVKWLEDHSAGNMSDVFTESRAIGISRLGVLEQWLSREL